MEACSEGRPFRSSTSTLLLWRASYRRITEEKRRLQGCRNLLPYRYPQTGVDSIAATWSLLGPAFAVIRPIAALIGGAVGGLAVNKWDPEKMTEPTSGNPGSTSSANSCSGALSDCTTSKTDDRSFATKCLESVKYGFGDMVASVGKWLVTGLIVAAAITAFVPQQWLVGLGNHPLLAMIAMVVIAVPMYVCATGSIPIALSLMIKGLTPGVGFVMLMAGPAANFASVMVLGREMGKRTTAIYVSTVVVTAIAIGLAIDYLMPSEWFGINPSKYSPECHHEFGWFSLACSGLLVILLLRSMLSSARRNHHHHSIQEQTNETNNYQSLMKEVYHVGGMACPHCQKRVEEG